ncbi:maleate cis-trans isomerase family protein [Mycobacterium sp. NPDC003449]
MYGNTARIGLIVPSVNSVVEPELAAHAPDAVAFYATRVPVAEVSRERDKIASILAMRERLPAAAAELGSLGPAALAYACTSGSFLNGRDVDADTCAELRSASGVPAYTTSTAVVAALRALGVTRLAVVTPYIAPLADGAVNYLEQNGFRVIARRDLGLLSTLDKGRLGAAVSARLVREADTSGADAVLISCTNWRTLDGLPALERELGMPVVSSNLATLWAGLRLAGIDDGAPRPALMGVPGDVLREQLS